MHARSPRRRLLSLMTALLAPILAPADSSAKKKHRKKRRRNAYDPCAGGPYTRFSCDQCSCSVVRLGPCDADQCAAYITEEVFSRLGNTDQGRAFAEQMIRQCCVLDLAPAPYGASYCAAKMQCLADAGF